MEEEKQRAIDFGDSDSNSSFEFQTPHQYGASLMVSSMGGTMEGHFGKLLAAAHVVNSQLSRLENSTHHLDASIHDFKDSTVFYHHTTQTRLTQLQDIITQVQSGIQDLRDKQKIAEVQLQLAKVQQTRVELQKKQQNRNTQNKVAQQQVLSAHSQDHQPHPSPTTCQQKPSNLPSFAPPCYPQPQNSWQTPANTATIPQPLGPNQSNFIQQYQTCTQPQPPIVDSANQQHGMLPNQLSMTQYQPYINPSFREPSQLPPPQAPYNTLQTSINQAHHQPMKPPYMPPPEYAYLSATGKIPLQQPGKGNGSDYGARPPLDYWSPSIRTSRPHSPSFSRTPKPLPRALPMAVDVNEASSSGGTERNVSTEDIVENAVAMGFRRNAVKALVKKLTENGQPVDLNLVLDKLINGGESQ